MICRVVIIMMRVIISEVKKNDDTKKRNGGCEDEMNDDSMCVCHIQGVTHSHHHHHHHRHRKPQLWWPLYLSLSHTPTLEAWVVIKIPFIITSLVSKMVGIFFLSFPPCYCNHLLTYLYDRDVAFPLLSMLSTLSFLYISSICFSLDRHVQ